MGRKGLTFAEATGPAPHRSNHEDRHEVGGPDELQGKLNANARVGAQKDGGTEVKRRRVNFKSGSGILLTLTDQPGSETVDLEIANGSPGVTDHGGLTGLGDDDHTQYLNTIRHDITARHTFGAALGTPGTPADVATAGSAGSGTVPSRSDHAHKIGTGAINAAGMFAAGVVDAAAIGGNAVGVAEVGTDWPRFVAQKSTQSISNNTETAITFTSGNEIRKVGFTHSSGSSVVEITRDCSLVVAGWVEFDSGIYDNELNVQIRQAGFVVAKTAVICNGGRNTVLTCATVIDYSSGEDLQLYCYQDSGSSMTIQAARFGIAFAGN